MKRLENAFPPVPDVVRLRVETTLKEIEKMKMPIRTKPRTGLLIAMLLVLLLAGIAYASSRMGLVDALLQNQMKWNNAPSEALLQSVIPLNVSETALDVKITLTDVAYDGDGLAIGYTCENLAPGTLAMVMYESAEANGVPMESREWGYHWTPDAFWWRAVAPGLISREAPPTNPIVGHKIGEFFENPGSGEWQVQVNFLVKRFPTDVIVVDTDNYLRDMFAWSWDYEANAPTGGGAETYSALLERIRSVGIPIAEGDERNPALWIARGYTVINSNGGYYGKQQTDGMVSEYFYETETVEANNMFGATGENAPHSPLETVGRVSIAFSFDSDQAMSLVEVYEPDLTFLTDVCVLRVRKVVLSPLATTVEFDLEPLDDDWSMEAMERIYYSFGGFALADQDGTPLEDLGWGVAVPNGEQGGKGAEVLDEEETRWIVRCFCKGPGLYQRPEALRIVTTDIFSPVDMRFPNEGINGEAAEAYLRRKEAFDSAVLIPLP